MTTDDQELISAARRRGVLSRMMNQGAGEPLWDALADALSTAAVRYRAEGWDEGVKVGKKAGRAGVMPPANPHRALLDENNEKASCGICGASHPDNTHGCSYCGKPEAVAVGVDDDGDTICGSCAVDENNETQEGKQ